MTVLEYDVISVVHVSSDSGNHFPVLFCNLHRVEHSALVFSDKVLNVCVDRHSLVCCKRPDFHYCTGEVCHTPKELFDLLADDYRTYVETELTKGKREVTEDDERQADALCKRHLEHWKEELE